MPSLWGQEQVWIALERERGAKKTRYCCLCDGCCPPLSVSVQIDFCVCCGLREACRLFVSVFVQVVVCLSLSLYRWLCVCFCLYTGCCVFVSVSIQVVVCLLSYCLCSGCFLFTAVVVTAGIFFSFWLWDGCACRDIIFLLLSLLYLMSLWVHLCLCECRCLCECTFVAFLWSAHSFFEMVWLHTKRWRIFFSFCRFHWSYFPLCVYVCPISLVCICNLTKFSMSRFVSWAFRNWFLHSKFEMMPSVLLFTLLVNGNNLNMTQFSSLNLTHLFDSLHFIDLYSVTLFTSFADFDSSIWLRTFFSLHLAEFDSFFLPSLFKVLESWMCGTA